MLNARSINLWNTFIIQQCLEMLGIPRQIKLDLTCLLDPLPTLIISWGSRLWIVSYSKIFQGSFYNESWSIFSYFTIVVLSELRYRTYTVPPGANYLVWNRFSTRLAWQLSNTVGLVSQETLYFHLSTFSGQGTGVPL